MQQNQFLQALFSDLGDGFIEVRAFRQNQKTKQLFYASIDEVVADEVKLGQIAQDLDVYFGVCTRQKKEGDKSSVRNVPVLWVDMDGKDFAGGKEETLARIKSFSIAPTIVVETGNGYHLYWLLVEPVTIQSEADIIRVESFLRGIAKALNADIKAAEIARVLRLPGTLNHKDPNDLKPVIVLECDSTRKYRLADFEQFLASQSFTDQNPKNPDGWIGSALLNLKEGNRNSTFASITGRLHHNGWKAEDILAMLEPHAVQCSFSQNELKMVVDSICKRYPNNRISFLVDTDGGSETETGKQPFKVVSLPEFLTGEELQMNWIVEGIFPSEGVAILSGPPGQGKSWMLLDLALASAQGGKWLDYFQTTPAKVLYIDEESSTVLLQKRLKKLLSKSEVNKDSLGVHFAVGQGLCLNKAESVAKLRAIMNELKPHLVIVDCLIRVNNAEENSAKEMASVFAVVKALVREFKCCFIFADHQKKPGKSGNGHMDLMLRGSTEKVAFVDTLLSLKRNDSLLIVEHSKSRFTEPTPSFLVEIIDVDSETTKVSYAGDAEAKEKNEQLRVTGDFLKSALSSGEWIPRKRLIELAKEQPISEKKLTWVLKWYVESNLIECQELKVTEGRGGKSYVYRWKGNRLPQVDSYINLN